VCSSDLAAVFAKEHRTRWVKAGAKSLSEDQIAKRGVKGIAGSGFIEFAEFILETGAQDVIAIQRENPVGGGGIDAEIPLRGVIIEGADEESSIRKLGGYGRSGIGAAAVENNDFPGPTKTLQAAPEVRLLIPGEDERGDGIEFHGDW
jgi:hypothetical protein